MIRKRLVLKLRTLTPVHIGSGQYLTLPDLVARPNSAGGHEYTLVNLEAWMSHPSFPKKGPQESVENFFMRIHKEGKPPEEFCWDVIRVPDSAVANNQNDFIDALRKAGQSGVSATQREADGRLRIPGSSIKGMLVTAWLRAGYPNERFDRSPFSCVKVADVIFKRSKNRKSEILELHRIYFGEQIQNPWRGDNAGAGRGPINRGWRECIPANAVVDVVITVDERRWDTLRKTIYRGVPAFSGKPLTDLLLQTLASYSGDAIKQEGVCGSMSKVLREVAEKTEQENRGDMYPLFLLDQGSIQETLPRDSAKEFWVPIGYGTHNFTKTQANENPLGIPSSARRRAPRHTAVVTRRAPSLHDAFDDDAFVPPHVPPGWIQLEVKEVSDF
jgi:hypothetical protein